MRTESEIERHAARLRELQAVAEIAHAFLNANSPASVYRLALESVTPIVGASFSSVFLRDARDSELLRVSTTFNWPQHAARFLDQMRIRVGNGPSGTAVRDRQPVECLDVHSDPGYEEWREAALELGWRAMIALPLVIRDRAIGAVTFYYREPAELTLADRHLLGLVAAQLAAVADKAYLIENLRARADSLASENEELASRLTSELERGQGELAMLERLVRSATPALRAIMQDTELLMSDEQSHMEPAQLALIADAMRSAQEVLQLIRALDAGLAKPVVDQTHTIVAVEAGRMLRSALDELPIGPVRLTLPDSPLIVRTDAVSMEEAMEQILNLFDPADIDEEPLEICVTRSNGGVVWKFESPIDRVDHKVIRLFSDPTAIADLDLTAAGMEGAEGVARVRELTEALGGSVDAELGERASIRLRLPDPPSLV